jgi:hypothetical protein
MTNADSAHALYFTCVWLLVYKAVLPDRAGEERHPAGAPELPDPDESRARRCPANQIFTKYY